MPKVISWTPEWLAKPNPGHTIFTNTSTTLAHTHSASLTGLDSSIKRAAKPGPRRTIACRGSEVFVAVGKEIRWADLIYLKDAFKHKQSRNGHGKGKKNEENQFDGDHAQGYRVCWVKLYPMLLLTLADHQNTSLRRYPTANHFPQRRLYCSLDYPHSPYLYFAQFISAYRSGLWTPQAKDIHPRPYNTYHDTVWSCVCVMASSWCKWHLFGYGHRRRCR